MHSRNIAARTAAYARGKLSRAVRFARECHSNWRETHDKRYAVIRDEAMADARYWRGMALDSERAS